MSDGTRIEWAHNTFNPWTGCTKVSEACKHCYAEGMARRRHIGWGIGAERVPASEATWAEPDRWDRRAAKSGIRERVFCCSMADVFEDRRDLDTHRERLWPLIERTTHLDWLLLTKRPENVAKMVPWTGKWPSHVWIGTTAENQERADERLPHLLSLTGAAVRFVSAEPLLGPLDLSGYLDDGLDWVIAGGESGAGARAMQPEWARSLRDQAANAGKPFFFKQWGSHGSDLVRLRSKKDTGRTLDGHTRDEFPCQVQPPSSGVFDMIVPIGMRLLAAPIEIVVHAPPGCTVRIVAV